MIRAYSRIPNCQCNPNDSWRACLKDQYHLSYIPGDHHSIIWQPKQLSHSIQKILEERTRCIQH